MADTEIPPLTIDAIIHIMTFLSISDRKACGLVNQLWREASLAPKLLDQQVTLFGSPRHDHLCSVMKTLQYSTRPFYHVVFNKVEIITNIPIWNQLCSQMRSLTLMHCNFSEWTLVDTLKHSDNLRALCIYSCPECLMSGRLLDNNQDVQELYERLGSLRELSLANNRYLSDALFNRFVSISPNLGTLNLEGCQISFHLGLYKKFYPNEDSVARGSDSVLTFLNILRYITRQVKKLKHLNLSCTLIDGVALTTLSIQEGLKLESLQLKNCNQLTLSGIRGLTEHQICLRTLDVSFCSRITDANLVCICTNLTKLESFKIRRCRAVTNIGVQHIQLLKHLKELDISDCEQLTGECITTNLSSNTQNGKHTSQNWQSINLYKFSARALNLDEKAVECITISFPNLSMLDIGYCFLAVTDKTIQMIFKKLVRLRVLLLRDCVRVSDVGLTGMTISTSNEARICKVQNMARPMEPRLRISLRSRMEEEIVRDADRKRELMQLCDNVTKPDGITTGFSLLCLTGLRQLDLSGCNKITDISLKHVLAFPELRILSLSNCQQITQVGLCYLASNNTAIEDLNLSECHNIIDEGIFALAQNLHRLTKLHLQGCSQLTDCSLNYIRHYCKSIQYLNVRRCKGMSPADIKKVNDIHVEYTKESDDDMAVQSRPAPPTAIPIRRFDVAPH